MASWLQVVCKSTPGVRASLAGYGSCTNVSALRRLQLADEFSCRWIRIADYWHNQNFVFISLSSLLFSLHPLLSLSPTRHSRCTQRNHFCAVYRAGCFAMMLVRRKAPVPPHPHPIHFTTPAGWQGRFHIAGSAYKLFPASLHSRMYPMYPRHAHQCLASLSHCDAP